MQPLSTLLAPEGVWKCEIVDFVDSLLVRILAGFSPTMEKSVKFATTVPSVRSNTHYSAGSFQRTNAIFFNVFIFFIFFFI